LNQDMTLDFDTCYRAAAARDPRFDGLFFIGVTSTGVFCRPICPSRTPARKNMRFFPHQGAAETAGFRACRRCRPEASPGSPEWNTRADLVARAVRLITDGYVDEHGIAGLARRLAVTERHLHRLVTAELGTGPLALARTVRLQTARRLLRETSVPITEIAFASGFSSVRQFNASFQESYRQPPSALRSGSAQSGSAGAGGARSGGARSGGARAQGARSGGARAGGVRTPGARAEPGTVADPGAHGTWLSLRLACREPFDAESLLGFLAFRAIPGVEQVTDGRYARTIRTSAGAGVIELIPPLSSAASADRQGGASHDGRPPGPGQVLLRVRLAGLGGVGQVVSRCRQLFDLDADPAAIGSALANDDVLAPLVRARPGLRVPGAYDGFELAVRAVLGQQVSVATARTFAARLAARYGTPLGAPGDHGGAPDNQSLAPDDQGVVPNGHRPAPDGRRSAPDDQESLAPSDHGDARDRQSLAPDSESLVPDGHRPVRDGQGLAPDGHRPALDGRRPTTPALLFPGPDQLADADLSGLGLTRSRQTTLRALAGAITAGRLDLDPGTDPAEAAARLSELPGIGPWTVAYILMRAVHDPDAYPETDLGLRRAIERLDCAPARAGRWRPWRAYAALHLWTWAAAAPTSATAGLAIAGSPRRGIPIAAASGAAEPRAAEPPTAEPPTAEPLAAEPLAAEPPGSAGTDGRVLVVGGRSR
jgi:AraC family transcriptional regulator, regulatory protein of adaptative response / DNA-3-methyladenine glycosylase II